MSTPQRTLAQAIEIYEVGERRLYAKTSGRGFAMFEDELTPDELIAIAKDIEARQVAANIPKASIMANLVENSD